ncbi:MAG: hypothetical protein NTU88_03980 [Armatimonadetes bacterium]|nr:hypothetical protein [Armatimonadota bacterium]
MESGWLVFAVVACIVISTGFVLAIALLRQAWSQREREALTSSDLRALEESALYLIEQMKAEADHAADELDSRCKALADLMQAADERIESLRELESSLTERVPLSVQTEPTSAPRNDDVNVRRILDLASSGMESSEIARVSGLDCAEVKLALRLAEAKPR